MALAPGRVRHLGDHRLHPAVVAVQVEQADRVERVAGEPQAGEQPHRAVRRRPGPLAHERAGRVGERRLGVAEEVLAAPAHQRRSARGPQRVAVEDLGQLVEVEERHRDPVAERVLDRRQAAVRNPALVDRRRGHAACASASWPAPAIVGRRRRQLAAGPQRAPDAVLVKAPAPVGAAVVRAARAADLRPAALRGEPGAGVDGVVEPVLADHRRRVDPLGEVERHQQLAVGAQRLEAVHVVGDRRPPGGLRHQMAVPRRPGAAAARQQATRPCAGRRRCARTGSRPGPRAPRATGRRASPAPDRSARPAPPRRSARCRRRSRPPPRRRRGGPPAPGCAAAGGRRTAPPGARRTPASRRRPCATAAGRGTAARRGWTGTRRETTPGSRGAGPGQRTRPPRPAAPAGGRRTSASTRPGRGTRPAKARSRWRRRSPRASRKKRARSDIIR